MRHALPLFLAAAAVSAQTVNTQVNGIVLTNGLASLSDTSAIYNGDFTQSGIDYLTDNDTTTYNFNLASADGGSILGAFAGTPSASATGIFIISTSVDGGSYNGDFNVQLDTGALSSTRIFGDQDFVVISQTTGAINLYQNAFGTVETGGSGAYYAYYYAPFADFNVSRDQVSGVFLSGFTGPWLETSYVGLGYFAPIPEPSTYGLMLGGLALAGAALRRRRTKV